MLLTPVESAHSYNQIGNWVGPKVERGSHLNLILIRHSLGFSKTSQFYDKIICNIMSYSSDDGLSKFISDQYVLCFKMSEAKKCLLK